MFWRLLLVIFVAYGFSACKDMFDYSPYEVRVPDGDRDWNSKQLQIIKNDTVFKPFRIAYISDTHTEYDNFVDFVNLVNGMDSVDLIINGGDITLSGISKEFKWYHEIITKLQKPIISIIGNHDYLSNGSEVFKTMFGPTNFTFVYKNCKFIMFDNIVWENPKEEIDYVWLDSALHNDNNYTHLIPFSHIPPWDEQIDYANMAVMHYQYKSHHIKKSFHGHVHEFLVKQLFNDSTEYVCAPNMKKRAFLMLNVDRDSIRYEQIEF